MAQDFRITDIKKAIKAIEKLQGNQSITGVYLDDNCISRFIMILYDVKEMIEQDEG